MACGMSRLLRGALVLLCRWLLQPDDAMAESPSELFAQLQAEAATTWRSPATADRMRGSDGAPGHRALDAYCARVEAG